MKGFTDKISPLEHHISFNKLLKQYDEMAQSEDSYLASKANYIVNAQAPYPELREGFTDISLLEKHKEVIQIILQDLFSSVLTTNEIKTASTPYTNITFNSSKRFERILEAAGQNYEPEIRNQEEEVSYIMACVVILNFYYGFNLDFKRPFFYDIPDANGVMRHYRILYNADFIEILPKSTPLKITQKDVDELLENIDNVELWKEKIPPNSFISKGFVISNMFDVTAEHSISEIKSNLIVNDKSGGNFIKGVENTFKSLFGLPNMRIGFAVYNSKDEQFERVSVNGIDSFILQKKKVETCNESLCKASYSKLIDQNRFFVISDVEKYYKLSGGMPPYKGLHDQKIKSALLAPIAKDGRLLGVLELVSDKANDLNSVNAKKLEDVIPYIVSAVLRSLEEEENLIDAVIQNECTSVHSSVYWKFKEEAKRFILEDQEGLQPSFREIVFDEVYPLYGQTDIKDSSQARNTAIQRDLMIQLSEINSVLSEAWEKNKLPIYEELIFRVNNHIDDIKEVLHTNSEQAVFDFVNDEINPVFAHLKKSSKYYQDLLLSYESKIDMGTGSYYDHRKNYDESVTLINKKLAAVIDKKQEEAQKMYPHYFERYKTDGVEHNMYIGDSITGAREFDLLYLSNLRLWQLQVMCEMENKHYALKSKLQVQLDVASLILVYNGSLSIRFRMDEKRFDVDGTYNARYEIIKKRIDKSYIKGTNQRLTQPGKIAIVYSQKKDELEYLRYIKFLKSKGYFDGKVEIVELEGLQGVSGLKAIRASVCYNPNNEKGKTYSYNDLLDELKA
ncbi:GAF domain-containing protein [Arenibacter sp. BSSL-BM3]|uniref:GAF domain-containing protein n=1 Tax=Arenibacter arenosicollis TaxID=2762274 RepID=A0ABR7QH68_9FLAO|nr:GAF domain-containing protein [Arenibacter arenosicollis]MBC8766536.1 GAF domain-containing protein [Arenibacter arenosicollis]